MTSPVSASPLSGTVDWGDGSAVEPVVIIQETGEVVASHVYSTVGVHVVTITVQAGDGARASATRSIVVNGPGSPVPSTPTAPPQGAHGGVEIACVFFDGIVPNSESDEYVLIWNRGGSAVDMGDWTLVDIADGRPTFTFPQFQLAPGQEIRVYTNETHPGHGGFSFGSGTSVWNNAEPDEAALFDAAGTEVSRRGYPPGC